MQGEGGWAKFNKGGLHKIGRLRNPLPTIIVSQAAFGREVWLRKGKK